MKTQSLASGFAAVLLCLAAGCGSETMYEIDLTPKGDQIERKLLLWVSGGGTNEPAAQEVARIARLYPSTFQAADKKRGFIGTFEERLPEDAGARGTYLRYSDRMGSTHLYVERFRGNDDVAAQVQRRQKAASALAQLIRGWCQQEFGREEGLGKLRDFIDKNLAEDLLSASLYLSPIGVEEKDQGAGWAEVETLLVRVGQYFFERGYFSVEDLPAMLVGVHRDDTAWLGAVVGRKLGRPGKQPSLAVFTDQKRLKESWEKYLRTTSEYQTLMAGFRKGTAEGKEEEAPKPNAITEPLAATLLGETSLPPASLILRLHIAVKPYATNGEWDESRTTVLWGTNSLSANLPTLRYASWSEPQGEYQREHFGMLVLEGDTLAEYVFWHRTLAEVEAAEWDRFVAESKPTDDLQERLMNFEFSTGAKTTGADMLFESLVAKDKEAKAKLRQEMREP